MRNLLIRNLLPCLMAGVSLFVSCSKDKEKEVVHVKSVALDVPELTLTEGETSSLTVTVLPEKASDKSVAWSSSDAEVASVSQDGLVSALKAGNVVIKVVTNDKKLEASCAVTVEKKIIPVTSVSLDKPALPLLVGGNYTLTATVLPETATDKSVTWASDNTDVVMVDAKGKVVGVGAGNATVTATSVQNPEVSASCAVTVTAEVVDVTGVTLTPAALTLEVGKVEVLTVGIVPADATNQKVRWEVSPEGVVSVDGGTLTGISPGTATVTATTLDGGFSASSTVKVIDTPITAIGFVEPTDEGSTYRVKHGEEKTLHVKFTPENPSNKGVAWSSSSPGRATVTGKVDEDGNPYAVVTCNGTSGGEVFITVRSTVSTGRAASARFYVWSNPESVSLPATGMVTKDASFKLTPAFLPSYSTENEVTWASENESVATVDETGTVTGIAAGTAVITATSKAVPSLKASCTVTVLASNLVSVNGAEAVSFATGELSAVLEGKEVTGISFPAAVLNSNDVLALNTACRKKCESADLRNVSFVVDGSKYQMPEYSTQYTINDGALPQAIFYKCEALRSVRIPNVETIDQYAFYKCSSLNDFVLPASVTCAVYGAFWYCNSLDISFAGRIKTLDRYSFAACAHSGELDLSGVETAQNHVFSNVSGITKVYFGAALRTYNYSFAEGNTNLSGIFFKEENDFFKEVNGWLFSKDGKVLHQIPAKAPGGMGTVVIPVGTTVINGYACSNRTITSLTLPEGLVGFNGYYSFGWFTAETLTLPSSLLNLSALTFGYASNLKTVTVLAKMPPTISSYSNLGAFAHADKLEHIYVPAASVNVYKSATGWKEHAAIISAIPE